MLGLGRFEGWRKRGWAVILTLALFVGTMELGLRLAGFAPYREITEGRDRILQKSPVAERVYEAIPGAKVRAWGAEVEINSQGFRDREYAEEKPAGSQRVLVLGDSIAFGNGLRVEETFSERAEQALAGGSARVEIVNLALGGYNTFQEVATLLDRGLRLSPDIVVVVYCINDIVAGSPNMAYVEQLGKHRLLFRSRLIQAVKLQVEGRARLTLPGRKTEDFLARFGELREEVDEEAELSRLMQQLGTATQAQRRRNPFLEFYTSEPHVSHLRYSLSWLHRLQTEHRFDVVLLVVPFLGERPGDEVVYDALYELLHHEARRFGFACGVPRKAFRDVGFESLRLNREDPIHPNARGHELLAEALVELLTAGGISGPGSD